MKTVHTVSDLRSELRAHRDAGARIALVPTMGNLHPGHLALVEEARQQADIVVTSIFVNPLQFGPNEDLDSYPRTLAEDQEKLESRGNDLVFAPSVREVYPNGIEYHTHITVPVITELHCGASRPGHFTGVATVVTLLFNMVQPDLAVFGEKDFQQLAVIRKLTRDLCLPMEIMGAPTYRESDGLAMSSRNNYLSERDRERAVRLYQMLCWARNAIQEGRRDYSTLSDEAIRTLDSEGFHPDYFNIVNTDTLEPANHEDTRITILAAAWLGQTRLIDNLSLTLDNN
ncbi:MULTISPECIES: pantoate--beta-alanine ligase [Halomonadaceae]|uniref:Pantothenate synthetase n=1 Tax=Vreelandella halophila TaxID=86177 RepID=A0A9X4YEI3_9GAMM|nr:MULTISPECIES: pantoate--beta-alanine ligase [Halomonas]MYL28051.1 pantoate--beta-alanine ligase [Halomonas utahensis]MYL75782.1 pantoate--beta-alanine ligase [Halomonas sp. 22501_18_FS]